MLNGIPVVLRPRVWSVLAHVTPYKQRYAPSYFARLVQQQEASPVRSYHLTGFRGLLSSIDCCVIQSLCDIEKDLCRTYPEHAFFQVQLLAWHSRPRVVSCCCYC